MDVLLAVVAIWVLGNLLGAGGWLLLHRPLPLLALPADEATITLPADVPAPRPAVDDDVAARATSPA